MSDPYREATRHERAGMSTLAKVFLVGGGLVTTLAVCVAIWVAVAARDAMNEWNEYWEHEYVQELEAARAEAAGIEAQLAELRAEIARESAVRRAEMVSEVQQAAAQRAAVERAAVERAAAQLAEVRQASAELALAAREASRVAQVAELAANDREAAARAANVAANLAEQRRSSADNQDPVAAELSRAVATVLRSAFDDDAYELKPAESGFGIEVTPREGSVKRLGLDFVSVGEILDRVAQGESVLAGVEPDEEVRTGDEDDEVVPDWVPVYPGSYSSDRFVATTEDISVGGAVFVVDARGHRILDWYGRTAWRMARGGTEFEGRMNRTDNDRDQDLRNDLGRYAMLWDGRSVSVFVIEDDHGDSLFVLLYKEEAEAEG